MISKLFSSELFPHSKKVSAERVLKNYQTIKFFAALEIFSSSKFN
jgi:hypothetical protein